MMTRDVALGMKLIRFDRREFKRRYGLDVVSLCRPTLDALVAEELVTVSDEALTLTPKGILWGDYVGHCLADALEHL
jgi:oxygen-independent coproporphyrinogen-3 oxidase